MDISSTPNDLRSRSAHSLELSFHILHVQRLDRVPVQRQFLRDILDRRPSAAAANKVSKALGVERIVRQKVEPFPLHLATMATINPPHLQFQKYPHVAGRKITHPPDLAVVPARVRAPADAAACFFDRRTSVMTRAFGSPKMPRTRSSGRKPANRYASRRRLHLFEIGIGKSCQFSTRRKRRSGATITGSQCHHDHIFAHTITR